MIRAGLFATLCLASLASVQVALAQQGEISVSPLPDIGEPGQFEGDLGDLGLEPGMGLQETQNDEFGFIDQQILDQNGVIIQVDPNGQEGVALIQAPNLRGREEVQAVRAANGPSAQLRALDKTLAQPSDFEMAVGETVIYGRVAIRMLECRYPVDNPASDAFAHLQIADLEGRMLFDGWMIASSPALMALEHPRYDVWVLGCSTS
ncbi:MAG: DUF2155 domain-containing protein [Pseudomonadota bacterium]